MACNTQGTLSFLGVHFFCPERLRRLPASYEAGGMDLHPCNCTIATTTGWPNAAAPPYFQSAIERDPSFAIGRSAVSNGYFNLGQVGRDRENFTKAFQLRERANEPERLVVARDYYSIATGELDKAA